MEVWAVRSERSLLLGYLDGRVRDHHESLLLRKALPMLPRLKGELMAKRKAAHAALTAAERDLDTWEQLMQRPGQHWGRR